MKTFEHIQELLTVHKEELIKKYALKEIGIFGSYVRDEQQDVSDLDILVEFAEDARISLLDFVGLENDLTDLLGVNVDLVEKSALKPRIGKRILEEVVFL
jgi:uncharacterized protein